MSIDDIQPSERVLAYKGQKQNTSHRKRHGRPDEETSHGHSGDDDGIRILGIPAQDLSPAIIEALEEILDENAKLKEELFAERILEQKLAEDRDRHKGLPVLTRHALMREANVLNVQMAQRNMQGVFAYFQIENFSVIKEQYGLRAGEAVIREIAEMLVDHIREIDRIGTLGGDGFGLVLSLTTLDQAVDKMKQLVKMVETAPIMFSGTLIDVQIRFGVADMGLQFDETQALDDVEADLHQRF
jgi:diguanylate cyclase (GGDEF)-like protein